MNAKKGLPPVFAAVAIQLTLGIAYIWSVFQTGVANSIFDGDNAAAGLVFSLLLATLTVGSVIGGKLAVRYSTRIVVLIGGVILSAGFFTASFVTDDIPWLLWVTYGLMGGVGMGFTYSTTIACVQKWYPHKKGFVTGIIVSALGFGGVVFTPIVELSIRFFARRSHPWLAGLTGTDLADRLAMTGAGIPETFVVLSVVFLVVCAVGCLFLKDPPPGHMADAIAAKTVKIKAVKTYTPSEMLKSPRFYLVTGAFMVACMGGLMMINFAKPIAVAKNLGEAAVMGVLAISMFNSVGRMVWGLVSDKIGRKNTIMLLLAASAVLSPFVTLVPGYWLFVLIGALGFFYGGLLSTFPSLTADLFGAKHMATNYGFVLLGFGAGAIIASQIAGHFKNLAVEHGIDRMFPAFVIASVCALAGIAMMLVIRAMNKKRDAAKQQAEQ